MNRHMAWIAIVIGGLACLYAHWLSEMPVASSSQEAIEIADLVALTDDWSLNDVDGCDAISLHDAETGESLSRGKEIASPGRVAARRDLSLMVASPSNLCAVTNDGQPPLNRDCRPWLYTAQPRLPRGAMRSGIALGDDFATMGGVAFDGEGRLLLALARQMSSAGTGKVAGAPFYAARIRPPSTFRERAIFPRAAERLEVPGLPVEFFSRDDEGDVVAVSASGHVIVIDNNTFTERHPPIPFPNAVSNRHGYYKSQPAVNAMHATLDRRSGIVYVNRLFEGSLAAIDLQARSSYTMALPADIDFVGGVSISNGWQNTGRIAIRTERGVVLFRKRGVDQLEEIGRVALPLPSYNLADVTSLNVGPMFSARWTGSGRFIITASGNGHAEFAVIAVEDQGTDMNVVRWLTACPEVPNIPMGIFTFNGLITPSAPPTMSPTPSAAPSATPIPPTNTPTSTPTALPSPTPTRPLPTATRTPTPTPTPIYLPILLRESCTPDQQRADVVLIVDASTSMLETTAAGRSKLAAAIAAAGTFLDQLRLDAGDQAAIVSFNADAVLRTELTALRPILDAALASITPASQTCLVCGVDVAATELASARHRADNTPVLILLTDGLSNPRPASEAVQRAAKAKAAGVVIHTIGLGDTLDFEALEAMASEPDDFHRAPDAEDLAAIYAQIAVEIPCPPSRYWGRR